MAPHRNLAGPRSVTRAVKLLRAFSDARSSWRLSDLARAARLHKATTFRLLAALEREGMVSRDAAGELYRLGPEVIALGARAARASDLRSVSRPELELLSERSGETATLEVLVGRDMLILEEVVGRALVGASASVGTRWPAHATSTGKALLAALPESTRRTVLLTRLARRTAHTVVTAPALARAFATARRRGYATALEELEYGFAAVGAAVMGPDGRPVAAISVGGPSARFTAARMARLGRLVRDAAARISVALGHRRN